MNHKTTYVCKLFDRKFVTFCLFIKANENDQKLVFA